jgi:vacuole morphology and inheritance protein 14
MDVVDSIVTILIKVSKGKSSNYSKLVTLVWFKIFFTFFKTQLEPKQKIVQNKFYFKKVVIERFDEILEPILLLMSHEEEEVRKASISGNDLLMNGIQMINKEETINFSKVMPLLKEMLSEKKSTSTSESVLKWMKFMLENYNDKILPEIN